MSRHVSTIILGAGTAALAAGNRLLDLGISDFLILEKGNSLNKRACPGVKKHDCKFCSDGCYTTEGVGGSNALHGNKICYFPASSDILNVCDEDERQLIFNNLNKYNPYINSGNIELDKTGSDPFKSYFSDVLNKNEYRSFINTLTYTLFEKQALLPNVNILEISRKERGFLLTEENGREYSCSTLVVAAGRSSYLFLKNIFDSLGVLYSTLNQDIGIRIETNKENFDKNYYYQVDPKIKFHYEGIGSARTFCAHNQGLVVPVQFGNSFFADGAFSDNYSNENNIALMVRAEKLVDNTNIEKWCKEINRYCNESLVLKKISLLGKSKTDLTNEVYSAIPFFPTETHDILMKKLIEMLFNTEKYGIFKEVLTDSQLTIYAPAIDRYWVAPSLDENLQAHGADNCFVIGDAVGKSRGIFQAMFSGIAWANKFSKNLIKKENNDTIWSSRVSSSFSQ